jgi:phage terminase large subunit-like protein
VPRIPTHLENPPRPAPNSNRVSSKSSRASRAKAILKELTDEEVTFLEADWFYRARPEQLAPPGDWRIWLFLGGRGAGKTRSGAEWIAEGVANGTMRRIGLIGATFHDARAVMIEGESGLARIVGNAAVFEPSNRRVLWSNGAVASVLSADEPDSIRGHQFDAVWADEFAKWSDPQGALDMILMGLRLGSDPRMAITTTPRAIPAVKDLLASRDVVVAKSTSRDNAGNLAPGFVEAMERRYGGSRLGRQELDAELIEDNDAAIWRRTWIEAARLRVAPPDLERVVVAVDPAASVNGDETGIVVAGRAGDQGYVLADRSAGGCTPKQWATRVAEAFAEFEPCHHHPRAGRAGSCFGCCRCCRPPRCVPAQVSRQSS